MDSQRTVKSATHFEILDLEAKLDFQTESSAGFSVGRTGPLRFPKSEDPGMNQMHELLNKTTNIPAFRVLGWIDVHHPCKGHIKAQLRIALPPEHVKGITPKQMKQ